MKAFKKLAILCAALLMTAALGTATACDQLAIGLPDSTQTSDSSSSGSSDKDSSSPEEEDPEIKDFVCRVKVQNATGYGFRGVTVTLKDGDTVVAEKDTSSSGYATFQKHELAVGNYAIEVDGIPQGYVFDEPDASLQTVAVEGFEAFVQINPTGLLEGTAPVGTNYSLGDTMYDFTVKTSDDTTFTLSQVLEEKELVMINFWATWCGPCKSEFPAMNTAYIQAQENVATLAISTTDNMAAVKEFKAQNGLQFDMTSNSDSGADVAGMFNTAAIPTTVMVDRYGVIVYYHTGSMTAASDFTSRFNRFLGEDYQPTVIVGSGEDENTGNEDEDSNLIAPPQSVFPNMAELQNVFGGDGKFTYSWDEEDEYSWPWKIATDEEGNKKEAICPTVEADSNYATLILKVNAKPGNTISFEYDVTTEEGCDIFYVVVDDVPVGQLSGNVSGTFSYVFADWEEDGEHTVHLLYLKDSGTSIENEHVELSNLRIEETSENAKGLVFRHAANVVNTDENATSYYKHYADVVLNENDGYYHVGSEDGPILFANLMRSSRWSNSSVWLLAYYDYIITEGYNFHADIEDYAWEANQPIPGKWLTYGYTPVTEGLKELLDYTAKSKPVKEAGEKLWTGAYHDKEWLEMCAYWEHYDEASRLEDPMKTVSFHAAEEVYEGQNEATVLFAMTPRGFKYKFTPERSGVYNIYSVGDYDTTCFLVASDKQTFLGTYTDVIGKTKVEDGKTVYDYNFYFHYYLEEGETYYLLMTTYLDMACSYDFYIDYVGETYSYLENLSVGPYSYNEVSGELFLPDAKNYAYNEAEDYYYVVNKDGSAGGKIYVNMLTATAFFNSNSLYQTARAALEKNPATGEYIYPPEKRAFYIDGVDYTETIRDYGRKANNNSGIYHGFVELDQTLFETICAITRSARYDGIDDSWQLLCYYYLTLGE